METNNIINIPEGFKIDKEQSNDRQTVLSKIEDKKVRKIKEIGLNSSLLGTRMRGLTQRR